MKKKSIIAWCIFVLYLITTVVLQFKVDAQEVEYEEVEVQVVSSVTKQLKNRTNGNTYNFYEVKVDYNSETVDLENAYNTYSYPQGKKVKAYLSNGRLFANVEGVSSSTPLATVYFVFLFASLIMLFVASWYSSKAAQEKREQRE